MFQELIDDYRRQAAQYIADALELESGRWRDQDGDQSVATAARKRGLAAMCLNWLTPMRSRTASIGRGASVPRLVLCATCLDRVGHENLGTGQADSHRYQLNH